MNLQRSIYFALALGLLPATLMAAPKEEAAPAKPLNAVSTVLAKPATDTRTYNLPGRTEAEEAAAIFTRATGIVQERMFDIGDRVKAGEVMAVIAAPEIDREVDSARAEIEAAQARAGNARVMADRAKSLRGDGTISQEDYDQRESTARELEAAVRVAQAQLARQEELQRFSRVLAPFDGIVTARNFDRGDRVRGDSATAENWLYRLARLDKLIFALSAPPEIALRTDAETTAAITFREFPAEKFTAPLARTSRVFDEASGTMRLEFLLENAELTLPAGLTGTASLTLPPAPGSYLVPTNTLIVRAGRSTVATVAGGKVHFVDVLPGRNLGPNVEVASASLTAETEIITNPNAMLREGDEVTVNAPPADAQQASR